MTGESWKIYWNEYGKDTYVYGSEIYFHSREDIEYRNELIQPGAVIKSWFSKVNYQAMRVEPTLPMIDGEGRYHIRLNASVEPLDGLLLKLIYYDRAIILLWLDNIPYEEIGEIVGISAKYVSVRLLRIKEELRKMK